MEAAPRSPENPATLEKVNLEKLQELLRVSQWPELRRELLRVGRGELAAEGAAEWGALALLALQAGLPKSAAAWAAAAGAEKLEAAAWLRLGDAGRALALLDGSGPRLDVLRSRAQLLQGERAAAYELAGAAHESAFDAGDAPALIAAIALLGELELRGALESGSRTGLYAALNVLAEGLNIAEQIGDYADPHILALLALAQVRLADGLKAKGTAAKAHARALAFSPAGVLALITLGRPEEACGEAEAGELAPGWWAWALDEA